MLFLARYVMQGPKEAFITVASLSVLTLWLAPVGFLLGAAIALVTLRVGIKEGAQVLGVAALVQLLLAWATTQNIWLAVVGVVEFMLPAWVLASVLRTTGSLATMIQLVIWLVGTLVIGFHLVVDDPIGWWQQLFTTLFAPAMEQADMHVPESTWAQVAQLATSMLAMSMVILWVSMVLFARWWQSLLYAPGRFQQDFHRLSLPRQLAWLTGIVALAGLLIGPQQHGLISDLFAVLSAGLMFHGLAVIHALVERRQMSTNWLIATYVLLLLFPQMILLLALIALFDIWMDLRQRYAPPINEE
ncbi:MAG TPA: DUF2232 domain-containing protein [Sulfurivirga caldicuralii]|nr:DUF2232 domain-containing protein [Sulfurivirga caldicuralii]